MNDETKPKKGKKATNKGHKTPATKKERQAALKKAHAKDAK